MRTQFSEDERDYYLTMEEISRVRKAVDRETIELDPNDATSTRIWVNDLVAEGHLAVYKTLFHSKQ